MRRFVIACFLALASCHLLFAQGARRFASRAFPFTQAPKCRAYAHQRNARRRLIAKPRIT